MKAPAQGEFIMLKRSIYSLSMVLVAAFVLSACSSHEPTVEDVKSPVQVTKYLIGPGDQLNIFVWRNPELSVTVPVRPDGKISTPLVEDMQAVGKSPTQLSRDIESVLSEYIKSPKVNIIVTNFVGVFSEQIRVIGQAPEPRALSYRRGMTILDVMIEVGGLAPGAAGNRAKVIRTYGGQNREISVKLYDIINKGKMATNIKMLPGDVLVIPESLL